MTLVHAFEVYLLLFVDSLVASMVLPLSKITAFKIMCHFGGYDRILSVIVATAGASIGGMINWALGKAMVLARIKYRNEEETHFTLRGHLYAILVLSLVLSSWVHIVGALVNVLCGFFKVRMLHVYIAVTSSYLAYFIYQVITIN